MWIWGTKIDLLWCERFPTYRSRSQIGLNPFSLLLLHHKYIDQVGKPSRRCFPATFWAKKNPKCGSGGRTSTFCDATDFQPTAQQVKLGLNLLWLLLIYNTNIDQVGKPSRRCFPAAFSAKKIRNMNLGDENRHTVMRPISNLQLNMSNRVWMFSQCF